MTILLMRKKLAKILNISLAEYLSNLYTRRNLTLDFNSQDMLFFMQVEKEFNVPVYEDDFSTEFSYAILESYLLVRIKE